LPADAHSRRALRGCRATATTVTIATPGKDGIGGGNVALPTIPGVGLYQHTGAADL
jgi:hypothetical protein